MRAEYIALATVQDRPPIRLDAAVEQACQVLLFLSQCQLAGVGPDGFVAERRAVVI